MLPFDVVENTMTLDLEKRRLLLHSAFRQEVDRTSPSRPAGGSLTAVLFAPLFTEGSIWPTDKREGEPLKHKFSAEGYTVAGHFIDALDPGRVHMLSTVIARGSRNLMTFSASLAPIQFEAVHQDELDRYDGLISKMWKDLQAPVPLAPPPVVDSSSAAQQQQWLVSASQSQQMSIPAAESIDAAMPQAAQAHTDAYAHI